MSTRHDKDRLLEVMGKVNPDFKLITEIKVLDDNINNIVEAAPELDVPEEQEVNPEKEASAAKIDQEAENTTTSDEDVQKPVVPKDIKGMDFTMRIPVYMKKVADKLIASLHKMATKLGIEPPAITQGEPYEFTYIRPQDRENFNPKRYAIDVYDITVNVDGTFKLPGNYKLVAVVDNTTGGSIEIDENEPVPAEYLETSGQCDLCKQERYRGKNFIVKDGDNGEYMVLGSSCVKKYIGIDPTKHLRAIAFVLKVADEMGGFMDDEELFGGGGGRGRISGKNIIIPLPQMISIVKYLMDDEGYVKREWTEVENQWGGYDKRRSNDGDATADKVEQILNAEGTEDAIDVPMDDNYVAEFSNWANSLEPLPPKMVDDPYEGQRDKNAGFNEYRMKVKDFVRPDRNLRLYESALLASAINYFENEKLRTVKAQEMKGSTWLGTPNEKMSVPYAKLENARTGEGQFGTWYMWEFVDEDGNSLKKFGDLAEKFKIESGDGEDLFGHNKGDVFAFTAMVKKHDDYQGIKSTMLGRLSKFK